MENNSIHPDEMERLLREAFLNAPDSETDQLADMMAKHAYNTKWSMTPPVDKAQHFVAKKLFFKGFSLNFMIGTAITIAMGIAAYFLIPSFGYKEIVKTPPQKNATIPTVDVKDTVVASKNEVVEIANIKTKLPKAKEELAPEVEPTLKDTVKKAPNANKGYGMPKPLPMRYILIPDISAQEAINNEKRKAEMVRQLMKPDKNKWAFIPMGTTDIEGKQVSLQAFYMQVHEVSNLQYRTFLYDLVLDEKLRDYEKAAVYDSGWINISRIEPFVNQYFWNPKFDDYPVVNITMEGAKMYCDWLTRLVNDANKEKGKALIHDLRIPAVEEWIYAARGGNDSAAYAWGGPFYRNSKGIILGNFQTGRDLNEDDGANVTAPVTSYAANPYGLYNMSGNVAEMTRSKDEMTMFIKGGAWNRNADFMKINHKNKITIHELPTTNVGFRPVFTFTGN